ncbi:hypothetical protein MEQU1_003141 [Malassezia equina]|uniref:Uncharacterized protein n=1 Tax=Malassezia equina TaxID=1381935 RepID=A0AAF0EGZ1_9BASI|nr:hypothetical protein MEQU1_003141 [Malassezia equina]
MLRGVGVVRYGLANVRLRAASLHTAPTREAWPPWQVRSARLAALHQALAANQAVRAFDAFLHVAQQDPTALTSMELRGMLRLLMRTRPRTPDIMDRVLVVIEQVKRAHRTFLHRSSPADALILTELTHMLQDASLWNALLTSARGRHKYVPLSVLEELLDVFVAAETAVAAVAAPERTPTSFPDTVSYNLLLHTLVRSVPQHASMQPRRVRRALVAPSSWAGTLRQKLRAAPFSAAAAEQYFEATWAHMSASPTTAPSPMSWCIRLALYTRLGRLHSVHACVRDLLANNLVSIDVVNAAMSAYVALATPAARRSQPHAIKDVYAALQAQAQGREPDPSLSAALEHVLGVPALPPHVVPDRTTHALVIQALTEAADLPGALHVLHDRLATPAGGGAPPTLDMYHTLFAGFARFGVRAHRSSHAASAPPGAWTVEGPGPWHIFALHELFEGYVRVEPTPPAAERCVPPPSPRALSHILAALQQVSGHDRQYVGTQWARLMAKLSAPPWQRVRLDTRTAQALRALNVPPPASALDDSIH